MDHPGNGFDLGVSGRLGGAYLAVVVSVQDPARLNRVQVRLLHADGVDDHDAPIWARVAVPCAGGRRGTFLLPDVGDEVLVTFIHGDSRFPVVVGSLWNGSAAAPDRLGGQGDRVDRWTIVGRRGSRIAIVEETPGEATLTLSVPGGVRIELSEASGGKIELQAGGCTMRLSTQGFSMTTGAKIETQSSTLRCTAGQAKVDSALADFSGVVKCLMLQTTCTVSNVYTPGLGNIW